MTRRTAHELRGFAIACVVASLAACGGSGAPGGARATATTPGASSGGTVATPAADATSGGGPTAEVCGLLTLDEVRGAEQIASSDTVTTSSTGDDCTYVTSDGSPVLMVLLARTGGARQLKTYDTTDFETISGVGDEAYFQGSSSILWMLVGDSLVNLHSGRVQNVDQARIATSGMGRIIAARLTAGAVSAEIEITAPPVLNAGSACDLVTADALAAIVGQGTLTSSGDPNLPQLCYFTLASSGVQAVSIRFQAHSGPAAWDSTIAASETTTVSGLGDKAAWDDFDQSLFVLRGDSIIQVTVLGLNLDSDAAQAMARAIARAAVGNL